MNSFQQLFNYIYIYISCRDSRVWRNVINETAKVQI